MASLTIDDLQLGMAAELAKTYDEWDIYTFAALTGDLNPAHVDQTFAEKTVFRGKIAHGMLTASLISAVLGTKLPGPGCIYLAQDLKFLQPVRIGDTVTAKVVVIELIRQENRVRLMTTCANQNGDRLLEGTALVMPSRLKAIDIDHDDGLRAPTPRLEAPPERARALAARRGRTPGVLVGQRMTPDPVTVSPDATVGEARALLERHRIRQLPVVETGKLVGILTDRDIGQASRPGRTPGRDGVALLGLIKVREVMTRDVLTIGPGAGIGQAAGLLLTGKIGGLSVVEGERLVGIFTVSDALEALAEITAT